MEQWFTFTFPFMGRSSVFHNDTSTTACNVECKKVCGRKHLKPMLKNYLTGTEKNHETIPVTGRPKSCHEYKLGSLEYKAGIIVHVDRVFVDFHSHFLPHPCQFIIVKSLESLEPELLIVSLSGLFGNKSTERITQCRMLLRLWAVD
jgi:hypothetical protein